MRKQFDITESMLDIYNRDMWVCQRCGEKASQIAHRIAQSTVNKKKYGKDIVHHKYNMVASCDRCNDYFNIGNIPEKVKRIIELIEEYDTQLEAKFITKFIEGEK